MGKKTKISKANSNYSDKLMIKQLSEVFNSNFSMVMPANFGYLNSSYSEEEMIDYWNKKNQNVSR